jgi:hypothetical protein
MEGFRVQASKDGHTINRSLISDIVVGREKRINDSHRRRRGLWMEQTRVGGQGRVLGVIRGGRVSLVRATQLAFCLLAQLNNSISAYLELIEHLLMKAKMKRAPHPQNQSWPKHRQADESQKRSGVCAILTPLYGRISRGSESLLRKKGSKMTREIEDSSENYQP